jgi:cyclase
MAAAYGSQCVVLSLDAKRVTGRDLSWNAYSHGGRKDTGLDAIQWAQAAVELGAGEILLNSIDSDGTGAGYDLELIRRILEAVPVPVIASGGAGNLDQIAAVLLSTASPEMPKNIARNEAVGADAALVASLLHFGKTTIKEIKKHAEATGVCVRN